MTPPASGEATLAQLMAEARKRIKLEEIGIAFLRPKVAATGAMLLKVPGENSVPKADLLATQLREALVATGPSVTRPVKELRITGLDESVIAEKVAAAVAGVEGCGAADVRVGDIRKGPFGLGPFGPSALPRRQKRSRLRAGSEWAGCRRGLKYWHPDLSGVLDVSKLDIRGVDAPPP